MSISFHPHAERELNDAAQYYDRESAGLGAAFLTEVERTCAVVAEYPSAGAAIVDDIRRRLLRRFPYALIYSVRAREIRVLAVMNLRRRPSYWVSRS